MSIRSPLEALQDAVAHPKFGSQAAMARFLGVSQPSVWRWLHEAKELPAEYVIKVERETGISRHALRPDLYPDEADRPATRPDRSAPHDGLERAR